MSRISLKERDFLDKLDDHFKDDQDMMMSFCFDGN